MGYTENTMGAYELLMQESKESLVERILADQSYRDKTREAVLAQNKKLQAYVRVVNDGDPVERLISWVSGEYGRALDIKYRRYDFGTRNMSRKWRITLYYEHRQRRIHYGKSFEDAIITAVEDLP